MVLTILMDYPAVKVLFKYESPRTQDLNSPNIIHSEDDLEVIWT